MAPRWRTLPLWVCLPGVLVPMLCAGAGERADYRISGKVTSEEEKAFASGYPLAILEGIHAPFRATAAIKRDGRFSIPNVPPGTYDLTLHAPFCRPFHRTVDVGPGTADAAGRIGLSIEFERMPPRDLAFTVGVHQLSVPDSAPAKLEKADSLLNRRKVDEARKRLYELVRTTPRFSAAWYRLGTIAYRTGQPAEAERCMREALRWDPRAYAPLVHLGGVLLVQQKHEEALTVNLEALDQRPDDPLAQSQAGESYFHSGNLDQAEFHLERARELEPAHYTYPQLLLARIHQVRDEPLVQLANLEEFLRLHPDAARAPEVRREAEEVRLRVSAESSVRQQER